ncbi:MAG: aldehyde dehydrogenase family protein, partial [Gammaproteobacteria bacterium]
MDETTSKLAFDTDWQYDPAPESTDHVRIDEQYELFIGGEFVAPKEGRYFDSINPANEKVLARIASAGKNDVDRAVKAARKAYQTSWSKLKPAERAKYIYRIARV